MLTKCHWYWAFVVMTLGSSIGLVGLNGGCRPAAAPPAAPTVVASNTTLPDRDGDGVSPDPVTESQERKLTESAAPQSSTSQSSNSESPTSEPHQAEPDITEITTGDTTAASPSAEAGASDVEGGVNDDTTLDVVPQRIVLLAPGGPLVVDVRLRINGESYRNSLERLIDEALAAADDDGDGQATWSEVSKSKRFEYGQFGNLAINNDDQRAELIRMYDRNKDGLVNRDELPRFLTRNAGGARAFSLRSSNEYRSDNRSQSPLRRILDADHDGAITASERAEAPARLLVLDSNDDQTLLPGEIQQNDEPMTNQLSNRRRTTEPDTAILINDRTSWRYVEFSLAELYAYGDVISPGDWPLTAGLFTSLDSDEDQRLTQAELKNLAVVAPHLTLDVAFGGQGDESTQPTLTLGAIAPEVEAQVASTHAYAQRLSLEMGDVEVEFFVNEDPTLTNFSQVAESQFMAFDRDRNGYLEEDELPANLPGIQVPFEAVDRDTNGKVTLDELASYLDLRQAAYRGQVRARAADQRDALFSTLDVDGDGRLNAREIERTPARLAALDKNQDNRLQSHEIPGSMVIGFIRGNPQADDQLYVLPVTQLVSTDVPRWFQGMDANADGEISGREFLGSAEQFARFDTNADGFLTTEETQSNDN